MTFKSVKVSALLGTVAAVLAGGASHAQNAVLTKYAADVVAKGHTPSVGRLDTSTKLELTLSLPTRNEAQLDELLAQIYDPKSPEFHHYLTPQEFDIRFGPTKEDFATLISWAQENNLVITDRATNNRLITVEADVETVNRVFHVKETKYHDSVWNRDFHAPDREPTTTLGLDLLAVEGLEDSIPVHNHLKRDPTAGMPRYVGAPTSGAVLGGTLLGDITGTEELAPSVVKPHITGSAPDGEYLPSDMRAAYYGSGPLTGTGQSVAIFSFDGYLASDVALFYSGSGTAASTVPLTNELVGSYSGACTTVTTPTSSTCDDGEQILDIVQVQGMAPGLDHIYFYEGTAATSQLNRMVTDNLAKVITSSWGSSGFRPTSVDTYFKQMATQGQTFLNATGDSGAFNSTTYLAPSVDAYIVQVGGTDLVTNGAGGSWVSETAWPDSGGGFYATAAVAIPAWQQTAGVITTANAGSTTYRNVPDISAEANFDNPTVDNGVYLTGYGGTSFAAPRLAGYLALANQQAISLGQATVGFPNPALYTAGLGSIAPYAYHDVTSGSNPATAGTAVSYNAVAGYDLVTGWGSPNGTGLINTLTSVADFAISMAAGSSPMTITRNGSAGTAYIPVAAYNGFTGTVTLTATNLPYGVTAAATSGTSSTPGTVTFTPSSTAQPGTYTVTINGVSGSLSHSTSFLLYVLKRDGGDFTMSATNASVLQGHTVVSTITVAPGSGLAGPVGITVTGIPAGVTSSLVSELGTAYTFSNATLSMSVPISVLAGSYPITVTGTSGTGIVHSTPMSLTVTAPPSLIANGGFETGTATPWTLSSGVLTNDSSKAHSGSWLAWMNGYAAVHTDTASQQVTITAGSSSAYLAFYLAIISSETTTTAQNDTYTVQLTNTSGTVLTTLGTFSNLDAKSAYVFHTFDVTPYIGQTVIVKFTGVENASLGTSFFLDDVSLVVQ